MDNIYLIELLAKLRSSILILAREIDKLNNKQNILNILHDELDKYLYDVKQGE